MFGKIIGAALGWFLSGHSWIGALAGLFIGSMFDRTTIKVGGSRGGQTTVGDFSTSLLILCAAVMKADGKIMRSELDFVKRFFSEQFGADHASQQILELRELLKQDIAIKEVCTEIANHMDYHLRLQLLHCLFGLANADDEIGKQEMDMIQTISNYMGIHYKDYESLKAMFMFGGFGGQQQYSNTGGGQQQQRVRMNQMDTKAAYTILEIESTATDDEVKKAYRKMAVKYHPDKVASLGEAHVKSATEKFQKVQEAYELIGKVRGIK
ncbi:MAG: TerB family tellurite resistance protein [Flavobacteriales bacterium]